MQPPQSPKVFQKAAPPSMHVTLSPLTTKRRLRPKFGTGTAQAIVECLWVDAALQPPGQLTLQASGSAEEVGGLSVSPSLCSMSTTCSSLKPQAEDPKPQPTKNVKPQPAADLKLQAEEVGGLAMSPSLCSMSTTCSSLANSPRPLESPERSHLSAVYTMSSSLRKSPSTSCQQPQLRAQVSVKAGASRVDQCASLDGKNQVSPAAVAMAAQRLSALTEARNARRQSITSEARSEAFCQDMVAKLGEIRR